MVTEIVCFKREKMKTYKIILDHKFYTEVKAYRRRTEEEILYFVSRVWKLVKEKMFF